LWGKEISYGNFQATLVKDALVAAVQVIDWNSTEWMFGLPQSVTMLKCCMCTASGVIRKIFSEVWQKYGVGMCVVRCFWDYYAKAQLRNFWSWKFLSKYGLQTET